MTAAQRLGFTANTKLLMIHADDAGLSHSENMATIQCLQNGLVNSYSIMVPCPWYYEMAVFAKNNPKYDYGIHLTLTCEWENYRFGPVLPVKEVPSLVDQNGHFYKKRALLAANARAEEVQRELRAQIETALAFGLNPSHLDSHMYSVGARTDFLSIYKDLAQSFALPALLDRKLIHFVGLAVNESIAPHDFCIDESYVSEFGYFKSGYMVDYYKEVIQKLKPGLNVLLIHPAYDNPEMRGITINHPNFGAQWRQIDLDFFGNSSNAYLLKDHNIEMIDWKEIKDKLEASQGR